MELTKEYATYLKKLIAKAGKVDSKRKVFGAHSHEYKINEVATLNEIQEFEKQYNLTLPEEYMFYLTEVSNGGAGPFYGLNSLKKSSPDISKNYETFDKNIDNIHIITTSMTENEWTESVNFLDELNNDNYDNYSTYMNSSLLEIGSQGCCYANILMLGKNDAGRMMYIDWDMKPDAPPHDLKKGFLKWMEDYFNEIIVGNKVSNYGYILMKTEKEVRDEYPSAENSEEKRELLNSLYRYKKLADKTLCFLEKIVYDNIENNRILSHSLRTLLIYDESYGMKAFDYAIKNNSYIASDCVLAIPEKMYNEYYQKMLKILYNDTDIKARTVVCFLGECDCKKAKDFETYAQKENDKDTLKLIISTMGKCPDFSDYIDMFIKWMKDDDVDIAHSALQAINRKVHTKLQATYEWLSIKYADNSMMRNNINNGIETMEKSKLK